MSFLEYPEKYDLLNDIISFGTHKTIKKMAIQKAKIPSKAKVLDVCCGTGDICLEIAKLKDFNGKIVGVDLSAGMLEIAKNKSKSVDNIEFLQGDALNLPFEDGEFDVAFISFGLRNLPNFKRGLQELKRVVKKGGIVVNLDMCRPVGLAQISHYAYLYIAVPLLGMLFYGDYKPYLYLANSIRKFLSQKELEKLFSEVGLSDIRCENYLLGAIGQQIGTV